MTILKNGHVENPPERLPIRPGDDPKDHDNEKLRTRALCCFPFAQTMEEGTARLLLHDIEYQEHAHNFVLERDNNSWCVVHACTWTSPRCMQMAPPSLHADGASLIASRWRLPRLPNGASLLVACRCVVHTWPIKYNAEFKRKFKCADENPDPRLFQPQAVSDFGGSPRRPISLHASAHHGAISLACRRSPRRPIPCMQALTMAPCPLACR